MTTLYERELARIRAEEGYFLPDDAPDAWRHRYDDEDTDPTGAGFFRALVVTVCLGAAVLIGVAAFVGWL